MHCSILHTIDVRSSEDRFRETASITDSSPVAERRISSS